MFHNKYKEIYPSEMVLKNTNVFPNVVQYLDLHISVKNNQYIYHKYDRTNDYPFQVIKYPNLSADIPVKLWSIYSTAGSLHRINQDINGFIKDTINFFLKVSQVKLYD